MFKEETEEMEYSVPAGFQYSTNSASRPRPSHLFQTTLTELVAEYNLGWVTSLSFYLIPAGCIDNPWHYTPWNPHTHTPSLTNFLFNYGTILLLVSVIVVIVWQGSCQVTDMSDVLLDVSKLTRVYDHVSRVQINKKDQGSNWTNLGKTWINPCGETWWKAGRYRVGCML